MTMKKIQIVLGLFQQLGYTAALLWTYSIIFNLKWLNESKNHIFFHTRFYTINIADRLKDNIILRRNYCKEVKVAATGMSNALCYEQYEYLQR